MIEEIERIRLLRPVRREDLGGDAVRDPFEGGFRQDIRLTVGTGSDTYTLAATAELRDAGGVRARRTVVARVERGAADGPDPVRITRWYDTPF